MNTLILIMPLESTWSPEAWARQHGGERSLDDHFMIEKSTGWLSIVRDDRVLGDYDEKELERLTAIFNPLSLFLVEWNGNELIEEFLRAIPFSCDAVVDNDHGVLARVQEVRDLPIESWSRATKLVQKNTGQSVLPPSR